MVEGDGCEAGGNPTSVDPTQLVSVSLLETEVYARHGDDIEAAANEMKPCDYCKTQHYEEFILRELVN